MFNPIKGLFKSTPWLTLILCALFIAGCGSTSDKKKETIKALAFPEPPDDPRYYYERTIRSTSDVKPQEDEEDISFRELVTGESGVSSGIGFGKPFGIIARKGRVYVGDTVLRSIMMFDPAKGKHKEIGAS
ncbi:MAG: hypothetical protein HQL69_18185, partial [Magnetococcales bacterium]|nr:hypothetical protein [Magnetococcales bacterium]